MEIQTLFHLGLRTEEGSKSYHLPILQASMEPQWFKRFGRSRATDEVLRRRQITADGFISTVSRPFIRANCRDKRNKVWWKLEWWARFHFYSTSCGYLELVLHSLFIPNFLILRFPRLYACFTGRWKLKEGAGSGNEISTDFWNCPPFFNLKKNEKLPTFLKNVQKSHTVLQIFLFFINV